MELCRMSNPFRTLQVARAISDEVNVLLRQGGLIHTTQLRDAAQSIAANIREGLGREPGPDRNKCYRVSRGSAEETDEHLRANFADGRLPAASYRRLRNRILLVIKMLDAILP
jgi:four helix bundle protein